MRRVRRQRLKYITILPSLVTILNGICGFTAIVFASKGAAVGPGGFSYFAMSGYMVVLAMIADMLDGRLARMNQSTSSFGGKLDSLSPLAVLSRGYALVWDPSGRRLVRNAADVAVGDGLRIRVHRGALDATVTRKETE